MSSILNSLTIKLIEKNKENKLSEIDKIYISNICESIVGYIIDLSMERATKLSSKKISINDLKQVIEIDNNLDNILMTKYNLKKYVRNYEFIDILIKNKNVNTTSGIKLYLNHVTDFLIDNICENFPPRGSVINIRSILYNKFDKNFPFEIENG